jgi:hypothetical protein
MTNSGFASVAGRLARPVNVEIVDYHEETARGTHPQFIPANTSPSGGLDRSVIRRLTQQDGGYGFASNPPCMGLWKSRGNHRSDLL